MKRSALLVGSLIVACATLAVPAASQADVMVGGRVGYYSEIEEPFVGAELLFPLSHPVYFNPNFEYVFVDGLNYMTLNGDFHYDFNTHSRTYVWLGAGLALIRRDFEGPNNSDTDAAVNFLGGVGWRTGDVIPYFQAKVIAKQDTEFVLAFGLRF